MNRYVVDYEEMGKRVRALRMAAGLSRRALAARLGVTDAYIGHIEQAFKHCSLEVAVKLCNALDCGMDYLLFGMQKADNVRAIVREHLIGQLEQLDQLYPQK